MTLSMPVILLAAAAAAEPSCDAELTGFPIRFRSTPSRSRRSRHNSGRDAGRDRGRRPSAATGRIRLVSRRAIAVHASIHERVSGCANQLASVAGVRAMWPPQGPTRGSRIPQGQRRVFVDGRPEEQKPEAPVRHPETHQRSEVDARHLFESCQAAGCSSLANASDGSRQLLGCRLAAQVCKARRAG